jgi:hypothetical protein
VKSDDTPHPFLEVLDGALHINPHRGQEMVLNSKKKTVLVLAGNQSGKTSIGAVWMYNQILEWDRKVQDPSIKTARDVCFWAVISSYPLLNEKLLPVYRDFFITVLPVQV